MRKTSWRVMQAVAGAVILFFLVKGTIRDWGKVREQRIEWHLRWEFIIAALIVTWAMYGILIWGWRAVLSGWRERLRIVDAARIWSVSSLGKYIPGKIWSIAGMALMAQQRGVSATAATGSAVIMQLVSLATGAMLALALAGTDLLNRLVGGFGATAAIVLATVALVLAIGLTSPSVTRRIGFLLGRPDVIRPVDPSALAAALFANLVAWAGYGISLQLLLLGTLRGVDLPWATATGAFAASYVLGYIVLFLPAGIGVRDLALYLLLRDTIGDAPALAIAAASRVALTVNEIGVALPFLLFRSKPSDVALPV
ncbi:MAG TPA: lysylphosphatidylglycerol synthase domain-containing protein [Gemmatimonadales bacterium]|jgi:hypothetical protein